MNNVTLQLSNLHLYTEKHDENAFEYCSSFIPLDV